MEIIKQTENDGNGGGRGVLRETRSGTLIQVLRTVHYILYMPTAKYHISTLFDGGNIYFCGLVLEEM